MAALFNTEADYSEMAKKLLGKMNEAEHVYKTDEERREMVRQFRAAEAAGDTKTAERLVNELFKEIELAIYKLANSLSSGVRSRRSGDEGFGSVHNDAEELKQIGTIGFLKALSGGEITDKNGTRKTGFDPDGPGTFIGFMLKTIEGYMKNAHTREKNKFGLEKTSLDAPRGDSDGKDTNLYNSVFADSDLAFDAITSDTDYEEFLDSDAFGMLMDVLDDVVSNDREKEVFKSYFGVDGYEKLTPTQIGEKYGFSKQRANQVVNKTLAKLKDRLMRDRTGKTEYDESVEEDDDEIRPSGMSLRQVERTVLQLWRKGGYDKREHSDDQWWRPVRAFFGDLISSDFGFFNFKVDSDYAEENENGDPTSYVWNLSFNFIDNEEKEQTFKAKITATGTAEGEVPLDKYKLSYDF